MDASRPLSLKAASELTGLPVRTLRSHLRDGTLEAAESGDGKASTVTLEALRASGLIDLPGSGGNGASSTALQPKEAGTWVPAGHAQELLRRLLAEREVLGAQWKETSESLYREIIEEQRERIGRLEAEKSDLVSELRDALRRIPKLMELEELEGERQRLRTEVHELRASSEDAERRSRRLEESVERLERDLADAQDKRRDLEQALHRLRGRRLWDRIVDRDPPQRLSDEGPPRAPESAIRSSGD